jgi:hypothetical protein
MLVRSIASLVMPYLPQQSGYVVGPIIREHDQEETNRDQDDAGQFHAGKMGAIQYHV